MEDVVDIKKLMKRQKAYMKNILIMTEKLFEIQSKIAEFNIKEIKSKNNEIVSNKDLMTSKEVCDFMNVSYSTLYRLRSYNNFPFVKIEGRKNVLFKRDDVISFLEKNK